MLAIIDYGMGNLRSVAKGFEKMGYESVITSDAQLLKKADGLVLPGVGAFSDAMDNLRNRGLVEPICDILASGKPFLGICLGLQLLFDYSEEWGGAQGLGIFPGTVKRLPAQLKIPHMGWNTLRYHKFCPLFQGIPEQSAFYFVHSYYVAPVDAELTAVTTEYGIEFTSVVSKNNVFGIQFHPEKSSDLGLHILDNFGKLVEQC